MQLPNVHATLTALSMPNLGGWICTHAAATILHHCTPFNWDAPKKALHTGSTIHMQMNKDDGQMLYTTG